MEDNIRNPILLAYEQIQRMQSLFGQIGTQPSDPLIYQDSLSPVPDHPFCSLGVLSAESNWGNKKGIAFVVEDNYLLTCASNCYSHQHGEYTNINFTIDSNRTSGLDTHKISKVFIPGQYKNLPQNQRKQYDYALLYIEGQPKMKDKYGSIGLTFQDNLSRSGYLDCSIDSYGKLSKLGYRKWSQPLPIFQSGTPLVNLRRQAVGLFVESDQSQRMSLVRFDTATIQQLAQWAHTQNEQFHLFHLKPEGFVAQCLKEKEKKPVYTVHLEFCRLNEKCYSFFEILPFSQIYRLLLRSCEIGRNLRFIGQQKFRFLQQIILWNNNVTPEICQIIASACFNNLKYLKLMNNHRIGIEGCSHLFKAQWPLLRNLQIGTRVSHGASAVSTHDCCLGDVVI